MSQERTLTTTFMWHDSTGSECECEARVTYSVDPGYAGDRIDPPQDASVEIISVTPVNREYDIPDASIDDDALREECMEHWREADEIERADAAEYHAERRAEELREERFR